MNFLASERVGRKVGAGETASYNSAIDPIGDFFVVAFSKGERGSYNVYLSERTLRRGSFYRYPKLTVEFFS